MTDTLLNVFLAIAVDNLANAQELTAAEEEAAEIEDEKVQGLADSRKGLAETNLRTAQQLCRAKPKGGICLLVK